MKTINLEDKQILELEQILTDKDGKAALNFVRKLVEKMRAEDKHRSCDQSAKPF